MMPKRAVITGASSGIGESFARLLATRGVNLVIAARRIDQLNQLSAELKSKHGIEVEIFQVDLSESNAAQKLYEFSTREGKIVDFLINNAGIGPYRHFIKTPLKDHETLLDLNIKSLTQLTYLFTEHMLKHKQESRILNVSSTASFAPVPRFSVYAASKSYVKFFSETLNHELKGTNISVSCLCPGGTKTEFLTRNNQKLVGSENLLMSSDVVARLGIDGTLKKKSVIVTGVSNKLLAFLSNFFPNKINMSVAEFVMAKAVAERD